MSWGDVLLIAGGFGAGFLSGTIGIGGGLLFVPTMTRGSRPDPGPDLGRLSGVQRLPPFHARFPSGFQNALDR